LHIGQLIVASYRLLSSVIQTDSREMNNLEPRAVIKFFIRQGKTADSIIIEMQDIYGDNAPAKTIVKK
jgi:hypothetical protein